VPSPMQARREYHYAHDRGMVERKMRALTMFRAIPARLLTDSSPERVCASYYRRVAVGTWGGIVNTQLTNLLDSVLGSVLPITLTNANVVGPAALSPPARSEPRRRYDVYEVESSSTAFFRRRALASAASRRDRRAEAVLRASVRPGLSPAFIDRNVAIVDPLIIRPLRTETFLPSQYLGLA
jgi:hypothetical protein